MNKLLELFKQPLSAPVCQTTAFANLIARAATKPTTFDASGTSVKVARGQLVLRLRPTAELWGWNHMKVSRFLGVLQGLLHIKVKSETGYVLVTICNYNDFCPERENLLQSEAKSVTENVTKGNLLETTSNLKQDNISSDLASLDSYFFVDDLYKLTYADYERLRKRYTNLTRREFKKQLQTACDWYRSKPEAIKKLHFQLLAWLDKANRKVGQ